MDKKGRIPFYYGKQKVYEWEQNLEEVIVYIQAPDCVLEKNREKRKDKAGLCVRNPFCFRLCNGILCVYGRIRRKRQMPCIRSRKRYA